MKAVSPDTASSMGEKTKALSRTSQSRSPIWFWYSKKRKVVRPASSRVAGSKRSRMVAR
jgi:hypothetical protein